MSTAQLQLSALDLVDAFAEARREDRDCIIRDRDIGDLMLGLVLLVQGLTCSFAEATRSTPGEINQLLREAFQAQVSG